MKIKRYVVISAFVLVLFAGGTVVLVAPIHNTAFKTGPVSINPVNAPLLPSVPITLYSVAHVERVVNAQVVLPNISALSSGFQIVGAYIAQPPTSTPQTNGPSYVRWVLNFYITNESFVNGTTLNTDLLAHSILITESNAPTSFNSSSSYDEAEGFINGGQFCIVHDSTISNTNVNAQASASVTSISSCTTKQDTAEQLVQIRTTYLAADPTTPSAFFEISGSDIGVEISPGGPPGAVSTIMSYQQLLALAGSMIPSNST